MNYNYALGRRKTAVATVRLYQAAGESTVNGKKLEEFVPNPHQRQELLQPLTVAQLENVYFTAKVKGSGPMSQIDAIKLALARAVVSLNPEVKKSLKEEKLLTRDPRMVERKKPGLRKARRAEQYSKR
jgi:small subunit ribosomal protein S9